MMKAPIIWIILSLCWIAAGCEKTEPVLLSGDIAGMVKVFDENYYLQENMAGVQVSLTDGTFASQSITDPFGKFHFQDIIYGNYQIDLEMEGYIKSYRDYTLHHLGGYSPTMVEYGLHEIPKFETCIDSIRFNGNNFISYIYVNLQGLSGLPRISYLFWCFFSNTPDVSNDQFVAKNSGWIWSPEIDGLLTEISVEIWDNRFDQLESDTIYLCVYPQALGQGYYDSYPESLGKASNVISFVVE
ncbi:MAG: hypothetical protein KAR19_06125 [Bacteroidales bacterium]|nr:hypothetical protein [Bacteroidales bacterium]